MRYDDLEASLGVLGYVDAGPAGASDVPPRPLSRGISRQNSFVSNLMRDNSFSFSEQELDDMRETQDVSFVEFVCYFFVNVCIFLGGDRHTLT